MEDLKTVLGILKNGGVIAYPSDTIPGIGCDATNENAVAKINEIKQRGPEKSLLVLVSGDAMLQKYLEEVPEVAWDVIDYATKPTTIVYPNPKRVAKNVLAADGSLGIRVVKEGWLQKLIHQLGRPLVSTSANFSGEPSPTNMKEISLELIKKMDFVVDLPPQKRQTASTIIKIDLNGVFQIIRK